ncbi:hypothetical protein FHT80_006855 [Rhizobium sp. BK226]|nr:hypothetical protein [Rhizobium sp. BK112]MBB3371936.1 hypothetical protein [Rhizobium sp. BK077]MBB4117467.1 hypothetical protein [Rhizobium sp. BK226]
MGNPRHGKAGDKCVLGSGRWSEKAVVGCDLGGAMADGTGVLMHCDRGTCDAIGFGAADMQMGRQAGFRCVAGRQELLGRMRIVAGKNNERIVGVICDQSERCGPCRKFRQSEDLGRETRGQTGRQLVRLQPAEISFARPWDMVQVVLVDTIRIHEKEMARAVGRKLDGNLRAQAAASDNHEVDFAKT